MERRFSVEAKTFLFSVEDGKCGVRMEERRKGFLGVVRLGLQCIAWVLVAVKEALLSQGTEDFVKSFREEAKAWIVRIGNNKDGRFLELAVDAEGGRRWLILFPEGRGVQGWNRVAKELGKVLVFLDTSSGSSPVSVLSLVERKDGMEGSGGAWHSLGGAFPSFAEVVRSEGPVKMRCPPIERRELDFIPTVRLADSEEVRLALDSSELEKEPLGKDRLLILQRQQSKGRPACLCSAQGILESMRKPLPHLKLRMWGNLLVRLVVRAVDSLLGRSSGLGLGFRPNLRFKGFCMGRVLAKSKAKKWIEDKGQGHPLFSEASFEPSEGYGSTSGLQQPEATKMVELGGGMSTPTSVGLSAPTRSGVSFSFQLGHKSKEELLKSRQKVTVEEKK